MPEQLGTLRVARIDGLPIPSHEPGALVEDGTAWADSPMPLTPGQLLGPFPPGTHTFRVWIGRSRLDDVDVAVRPGRLTTAMIVR